MITVIDCMTGESRSYDPDVEIAAKLASGLRFAVYRNGERYTDYPLTLDDCLSLAEGWQSGSLGSDRYTVAEWTD